MNARNVGILLLIGIFSATTCGWPTSAAQAAEDVGPFPSWDKVEEAVSDYFASIANHRPDDLIVQSEAQTAMQRIAQIGWKVDDAAEIVAAVPADGSFLATTLRSPAGHKFMESMNQYPDGYDRLDRLSKLPRGQQMVRDLVRGPGGYKMIEYMTTASGGIALGKQLSRTPKGADFNKPTERIYTERMLLDRLQQSYHKAARGTYNAPSAG